MQTWFVYIFLFTFYMTMCDNIEKACFKAVSHVVFDVDGLLLGTNIMLYSVHCNLFSTGILIDIIIIYSHTC